MDEDAVRDVFETFGPIGIRRMFGGLGIYADGVMFALVAEGEIYLKTDPDFARRLGNEGAHPFVYEGRGRKVTMSYWSIPLSRIDDADAVAEIAREASRIALRAAAAKPPKGAPRQQKSRKE